jgi:hypothetical protein
MHTLSTPNPSMEMYTAAFNLAGKAVCATLLRSPVLSVYLSVEDGAGAIMFGDSIASFSFATSIVAAFYAVGDFLGTRLPLSADDAQPVLAAAKKATENQPYDSPEVSEFIQRASLKARQITHDYRAAIRSTVVHLLAGDALDSRTIGKIVLENPPVDRLVI